MLLHKIWEFEPHLLIKKVLIIKNECIQLKSKVGTSGYQLFPTFFAFSESAHQTEWENAQGAMKTRKEPKMGHPTATL